MVTTIMTFVHWSKGEEAEGRGESSRLFSCHTYPASGKGAPVTQEASVPD